MTIPTAALQETTMHIMGPSPSSVVQPAPLALIQAHAYYTTEYMEYGVAGPYPIYIYIYIFTYPVELRAVGCAALTAQESRSRNLTD